MKKTGIKEIALLICLMAFIVMFFGYMNRLHKEYDDPYAGDTTYFDELVFHAVGTQASEDIRCYTDKENDYLNHWIFLPGWAELDRSVIEFKESDHISITDESGSVMVKAYGDAAQGLDTDNKYSVTFYDEKGNELETGGLTIKKASELSSIFIYTASKDLKSIHEDKEYKAAGSIHIINSKGAQVLRETLKGFKGHGNTTWQREKKPYQIKLEKMRDLFGMGAGRNWILLANAMDPSGIRNSVAYELARRAGMENVTGLEWTELYIDGEYRGLYQLSEKVEVGKTRVDITNLEKKNGYEYDNSGEAYEEHRSPNGEEGEKIGFVFEGVPSDITGGYLVEHNYDAKYESGTARFITKAGEKYILRSPAFASVEEVDYITALFDEMDERAVRNDDSICEIIDPDSFAMKYTFEELIKNDGAGVTSSYFYKDTDSIDPLIYAGPVWDYDKSMGNGGDIKNNIADTLCFNTAHRENTTLFLKLWMNNEGFRERVRGQYKERFSREIPEMTRPGGYIDSLMEEMEKDNGMDRVRWNLSDEDRLSDIQRIKDFLNERKVFLDEIWGSRSEDLVIAREENSSSIGDVYVGYLKGSRLGLSFSDEKVKYYNKESGERIDENTILSENITVIKK